MDVRRCVVHELCTALGVHDGGDSPTRCGAPVIIRYRSAIVRDPGWEANGQRIGVVLDLGAYRMAKCAQSSEGHQPRDIAVPGRKIKACTRCGMRWQVSG